MPLKVLEKYWGYTSFRPLQREIIDSVLEGRDTLALLPTGGGKSICFQVPQMLKEGLALVISPLIALMKDQVENLRARGICALALHSGMSRRELENCLSKAAYDPEVKFLYLSPERLNSSIFLSYIDILPISTIVVDEAHCISQWGYDFRPDYLRIGKIRELVKAPVLALTATATIAVCEDIMKQLGFSKPNLLRGPFERENLCYIVRECRDKAGQLLKLCSNVPGSGVVYLRNRSKCEEVARFLKDNGVSADFYHAGLPSQLRAERQRLWMAGQLRVMVCTNAFGMGIDKSDVRFVVHLDVPDSPEAYFQEAGRAGRDGKTAYALLLWNSRDISRLREGLRTSFPELEYVSDVYQKLHLFFAVPYEQGMGRELRFNLHDFCTRFHLSMSKVHYSLDYLSRIGHITYVRDLEIPTKIKILPDRQALYNTDIPDSRMHILLDLLMREYAGIFSFPVPVDEKLLAARMSVSVPALRQLFYSMSLEHLLQYVPCVNSDVILLRHNRLRPGNINLLPEKYSSLQKAASERIDRMEEYCSRQDICRASYLIRYFGQEEVKDCGRCDVCRNSRNSYVRIIGKWVEEHPQWTEEELLDFCRNPESGIGEQALPQIRSIIDSL